MINILEFIIIMNMKIIKVTKSITFILILSCPLILCGATFSDLNKDAKTIGMGGAYEGSFSNISAINYNPAIISDILRKEINISYGYFTGDTGYLNVLFGCPVKYGVVGCGVTSYEENNDTDTGDKHDNLAGILSWSIPIYEEKYFLKRRQMASAGINIKVINKTFAEDENSTVFAVDLGILYKWPFDRNLSMGIALRDIGGNYEVASESKRLPSLLEINMSKKDFIEGLNLAVNGGVFLDDDSYLNLGGEYNIGEEIFGFGDLLVRGGITSGKSIGSRITVGAGIELGDFMLDYGTILGDLSADFFNSVSIKYMFGAIKENISDIEGTYRLGKKNYFQGNLAKAEEKFELVYNMNRNYKETGRYLEKIKKIMAEIRKERPLLESDFEKVVKLINIGDQFYNDSKYEDAIKYYSAALVIDENNMDVKQKINDAKHEIDKLKEHEKQAAKQVKDQKYETLMLAHYNKGGKYFENKKYQDALSEYTQGKNLAGRNEWRTKFDKEIDKTKEKLAETYYEIGYRYYQQNKFDEATVEFKKALNYNSSYKAARETLEKIEAKLLQINEKKSERLYEQGMGEYSLGNIDAAVELWKKALIYDKNNIQAKNALERQGSMVNYEMDEEINKTDSFKALKVDKVKAEKLYEQGMDQYAAGYVEKAIELWETALQYDSSHIEARKALERVKAKNQN